MNILFNLANILANLNTMFAIEQDLHSFVNKITTIIDDNYSKMKCIHHGCENQVVIGLDMCQDHYREKKIQKN